MSWEILHDQTRPIEERPAWQVQPVASCHLQYPDQTEGLAHSSWHQGGREGRRTQVRRSKAQRRIHGPAERKTFEEVAKLFVDDRKANNRRISTLEEYKTELKLRLLPLASPDLPLLGPRDIRNIKRGDMKAVFNALRNGGRTVSQVNKSIKAAKEIFTYGFDCEYVTSNIMHRFPRLQRVDGEPTANRGVFSESELQSIFGNATAFELALFGTLSISGPRPGEIYALGWSAVYLDVDKPYLRIERTWCSKGFRFYSPKTEAGKRTVPISAWLAAILREHRGISGGVGLAFPSAAGTPLNKANVRKRVWIPLLERAQVRYRDMYSLRWTFVSLARASGEAAFNVSRVIGHARSTIVDTIYAHTVDSALAGVSESVAGRIGLTAGVQPTPPSAPSPPTPSSGPPKLRVIDGGRARESINLRDGRKPVENARSKGGKDGTSA
jgi:integrase